MRVFSKLGLIALAGLFTCETASAQFGSCYSPFSPGFWGVGYAPMPMAPVPMYGYSGWGGSPYSAGYGSFDCGCSPCSNCGGSCGVGNCGGVGCGTGCSTGCGVVESGTLKPSADPNFREKSEPERPAEDLERRRDNLGTDPRDGLEDTPRRTYDDPSDGFLPADPARSGGEPDLFDNNRGPLDEPTGGVGTGRENERWAPSGGDSGGSGNDDFPSLTPRATNKPPISDPLSGTPETEEAPKAVEDATPESGSTEDPTDLLSPESSARNQRPEMFVSRLRDVLPVQRTAGRGIPVNGPGKAIATGRPIHQIRWIAAPAEAGLTRL
ncbi:MAG: hypothetical protein KDA91_21680 [Planctomycetaceae bacterium]|nr:hypothetical protein [Planctomycetaceae bacterium]